MRPPQIEISSAPSYAFGQRGLLWWGTLGMIALEGVMFAMIIVAYLYLKTRNPQWPPGFPPPYLLWGTVNLVLVLVSVVPNELAKRAAEKFDLRRVLIWLGINSVLAMVMLAVRYLEFRSANVWWDSNAYGSLVWLLLGFHTFQVATDLYDSIVLWALLVKGPIKETRFVDVYENAMYWYFVVVSWLPVYVVIYLAPRYW